MPFAPGSAIIVKQVSDRDWTLQSPIRYHGESEIFTAPVGYKTDFASIPRIAAWLIPTYGRWTPAAILHDVLLTDYLPERLITSHDVDGIFRRVLRELGVGLAQRWFMWAGVRWGALFNRKRRAGILRDIPKLLLVSLLALPVVLPGAVGVAVGLVAFTLTEVLTGDSDDTKGLWKT